MEKETKDYLVQKVNDLIAAASCCPEAREAARNWLDALGTTGEKEASRKLIAELKEDVTSIDGLIALLTSEDGPKIFGKEAAENMLSEARESKAKGNRYCICPACQAGGAILDKEALMLS